MFKLFRATAEDADTVAPLFDAYRAFFTGKSDEAGSLAFVQERLKNLDSAIFLATGDGSACGFVQLYPLFSSWYARRIWFLSDLYVKPESRGKGIATGLVQHVKQFANETKAGSVMVELPKAEPHLYRFYDAMGFHLDTVFDLARYHPQ